MSGVRKTNNVGRICAISYNDEESWEKVKKKLREVNPGKPTEFHPGTAERVVLYAMRKEGNLPLFIKGDNNSFLGFEANEFSKG